jgi:hypothetical protein
MTNVDPPSWFGTSVLAECFRAGGTPAVISPNGSDLAMVVTGYATNGDASVYANATLGIPSFNQQGTVPPPSCSQCGGSGELCCRSATNGCNAGDHCTAGPNNTAICE